MTNTVVGMPAVRHETTHFALRWRGADASAADAASAARVLESTWQHFTRVVGFTEPDCTRALKRRVDVHVDPSFGLTGGATAEGTPAIWIGPGALKDHFGLAHELTHALQYSSGGLQGSPYTQSLWETHANFMATQMPRYRQDLHGSETLINYPHLYYGSSRDHYLNFEFLEWLKLRYGYQVVNDLWFRSPRVGTTGAADADPWSVLAANQGWSTSQLNDVFARWAMANVTFDYTDLDDTDRGPLMRQSYGSYDEREGDRRLRITELDLLDLRTGTYRVPFTWAPQRWGYNLVRLLPTPGSAKMVVTVRGLIQTKTALTAFPGWPNEPHSMPIPRSGWRWAVVSVDADGRPRYSRLQKADRASLQVPVRTGDSAHYLMVMATPTAVAKVAFDQVHYSIYRYPWTVTLRGAVPDDGQRSFLATHPGARRHSNGGGWVAAEAHVAETAFVGPQARVIGGTVTGRSRILDHATVISGTVDEDATVRGIGIVSGDAVVRGRAIVDTTFRGVGAYARDVELAGNALALGDLELWSTKTLTQGVHCGFVDDSVLASSAASIATGFPGEVTARPR